MPRKPSPRRITHICGGWSQLPDDPVRIWHGILLRLSSSRGSVLRAWAPTSKLQGRAVHAGHCTATPVRRDVRLRQFRRRRESTSDIDEPHRARIGVIGDIQNPKFTKWACYAPRVDEGTDFWGIGEAVGPRRLSRKPTVLTSTAGDEVEDPPGEAPAASAAQAAQGRVRKREASWAGWAGVQVGWQGN